MTHLDRHQKRQRRKKRRHSMKAFIVSLLVLFAVSIFIFSSPFFPDVAAEFSRLFGEGDQIDNSEPPVEPEPPLVIHAENLNSKSALLMRLSDGKVLWEQNGNMVIYPASMTKIMTAILGIEYLPDLDQQIELSSDLFHYLYGQNASTAGFMVGEAATVRDLLYGVILPSGAECCLGLATEISGSEQQFVELMNEKASEIGMRNTHFFNSTGLHDDRHDTTAKDIAVLLRYALENEEFRTIFTRSHHTTTPSNKHPEGFTFTSSLFRNMDQTDVINGHLLGGKTGYTGQAGLCLASLATINGVDYILVTAGAEGNHQTEQFHITDALSIYNQVGEQSSD